MPSICVLALVIQSAWAEIGGCSANLGQDSCHGDVLLGDATALLQQRMVDRAEHGVDGLKAVTNWVVREEKVRETGRCPEGEELAYGDACDRVDPFATTTPAPLCVDGKTASGKACQGKIKIKTMTTRVVRPCETASGDECEGEFPKKIRETYQDKDGKWVLFKREQSQDGGKTWSPLPVSLAEIATVTLTDDEAEARIPYDSCCIPSTTTASPSPSPTPTPDDCEFSEWSDWTACNCEAGGTRSRSRTVLSPADHGGKCGCLEEAEGCIDECAKPEGVVSGTVKNAKNNQPIAGAIVQITSQGLQATTSDIGEFHFGKVDVGEVVLTATAKNYANYESGAIHIEEASNKHVSIKMVQPSKPGLWTIVLTWTKGPKDLDSVTTFGECEGPGTWTKTYFPDWTPKGNGGEKTSVYFDAPGRSCVDASGMKAYQDIDNQNIYGEGRDSGDTPETTTLTKADAFENKIFFKVEKLGTAGNEGTIADSDAQVEVHGPGIDKTFTIADAGFMSDDKTDWFVFYIKDGVVTPCKPGHGCK